MKTHSQTNLPAIWPVPTLTMLLVAISLAAQPMYPQAAEITSTFASTPMLAPTSSPAPGFPPAFGSEDPRPPRLRLEVGKTYCFEYGYRWTVPWSVPVPGSAEEGDRTYPAEERTWYQLRVTGSEQDTLYRCRVRISRMFHYEQNPFGYDVFDSRYPTPLNTGDARLLADGFTYTGTINAKGRFLPDAGSQRRIDSLAARMDVIMSGDFGGCDDSCFLEKTKDLLYRNLGILQLFYPGSQAAQWEPVSSPGFGPATGRRPLAGVSEAYEDVAEMEFLPRKGKYSLIRLTYERPE